MRASEVTGGIVELDTGAYYKIENTQNMPAFFINLAAASDLWVFCSSNGALTAGRQNADGAMFPYETDDRLHIAAYTGPRTYIRMPGGGVWEPFSHTLSGPDKIRRNLYKRLTGDAVIYEEINETLGLSFSYRLETGKKYGLVRTARIKNEGAAPLKLDILDGMQNIIPFGIPQGLADSSSCLTDAYKACERVNGGSLAVFSLTSAIVDAPEPVEILNANVAWRIGVAEAYLLSAKQAAGFCGGETPADEQRSAGMKAAYLAYHKAELDAGASDEWVIVMDAGLSQAGVMALAKALSESPGQMLQSVQADIERGTEELTRIVASADGLQLTADGKAAARHYMNTLYNNMRGGVFADGYNFEPGLLEAFVKNHNKALYERRRAFFEEIKEPGLNNILVLHEKARAVGDADLNRLCGEFLPLTFSRRHGDPSRPWNRFHIRVKDGGGNRLYHYEGNWRDIFQNWEAMSLSFPYYIEPIIAKFLNASTADGFNPYRVNGDGVDWETPQPHNPFSGYGYWGDHQIVYLNKLLEWLYGYAPEGFKRLASGGYFVYADVPYEIKPYAELLKDGKNTVVFNQKKHEAVLKRAAEYGGDGKLLTDGGGVRHASFIEKLLIPILAKLSNLVPGGGIWMNTQRPEWNDANNAIVGNGLSVVTVCQLYRHVVFCKDALVKTFGDEPETTFTLSAEVVEWLNAVKKALNAIKGKTARAAMDELGAAFDAYRSKLYAAGLSGGENVPLDAALDLFDGAAAALADTIRQNKRDDGLYNAYNIMTLTRGGLEIAPMFPMLEGQTAALGSGLVTPEEALALAGAMNAGGLYSPEHKTYYLYPVKRLKTFIERNIIPPEAAETSALAARLLKDGRGGLVLADAEGNARFDERIRQSADLERALGALKADVVYAALAEKEADVIRGIYEDVFAHRQFTGRSGIMYKYEGIGSIYWHQNSKFILSFQECFTNAAESGAGPDVLKALKEAYYTLREGLGFNKEPSLWGAFPLEPYSHTPYGMPAQQPGMTGQVKEDILTRRAELGITAKNGMLYFEPALLERAEFLTEPAAFEYITPLGERCSIDLNAGELAFTVCQTPVVYRLSAENKVTVYIKNGGTIIEMRWPALSAHLSRSLFAREGVIERVEVEFGEGRLV